MPKAGKRQLNVFVSIEAFDGLRAFATDQGVSVTAIIEGVGLGVARLGRMPSQRDVLRDARVRDAQSRDRRPK